MFFLLFIFVFMYFFPNIWRPKGSFFMPYQNSPLLIFPSSNTVVNQPLSRSTIHRRFRFFKNSFYSFAKTMPPTKYTTSSSAHRKYRCPWSLFKHLLDLKYGLFDWRSGEEAEPLHSFRRYLHTSWTALLCHKGSQQSAV